MFPMGSYTQAALQQQMANMMNYGQMMPTSGYYTPQYPQNYQRPQQPVPQQTVPQQTSTSVSTNDWRNKELINGVKAGDINKEEFTALGTFRNDTAKIVGMMGADGSLSTEDRQYISYRERQYDNMYQQYKYGNYYPNTTRNDELQQQQIRQLGQMWVGLKYGDITRGEGNYLINESQDIAARRGQFLTDGSLSQSETSYLSQGLNNHQGNINTAINNSVKDGYWGSDPYANY